MKYLDQMRRLTSISTNLLISIFVVFWINGVWMNWSYKQHKLKEHRDWHIKLRIHTKMKPYRMAKAERNCLKARDLKLQHWYKWNTPDSLICQCAIFN